MSWWQIIAVFVGIPAVLAGGISAIVYWLADSRVPDGIARAAQEQDAAAAAPVVEAPENEDSPENSEPS